MPTGPLKLKAQVMCGDEIAMGPGKADLLDAIARERSISRAAGAMGMSYRRAWLLVDTMNRCWHAPLVDTVPGGGARAGARLTETGRRVLALYRAIEAELDRQAETGSLAAMEDLLRARPLAEQARG